MAGTCKHCGFSGTNDEMMEHAGEMCHENQRDETCPVCGGDGKETCNNPDHGAIESGILGGEVRRLGCPVCGHDPDHKVPDGGKCEKCGGTGGNYEL